MRKQLIILISMFIISINMVLASNITMNYTRLADIEDFPGYVGASAANTFFYLTTGGILNNRTIFFSDQIVMGACYATETTNQSITYNYSWYVNGVLNRSGVTGSVYGGTFINVDNFSITGMEKQNISLSCSASNGLEISDVMTTETARITYAMKNFTITNVSYGGVRGSNQDETIGNIMINGKIVLAAAHANDAGKGYFWFCSPTSLVCEEKKFTDDSIAYADITILKSGKIGLVYKKSNATNLYLMICESNGDDCTQTHTTDRANIINYFGSRYTNNPSPISILQLNNSDQNIIYVFQEGQDISWYTCNSTGGNCNYYTNTIGTSTGNGGSYEVIALRSGLWQVMYQSFEFDRCVVVTSNKTTGITGPRINPSTARGNFDGIQLSSGRTFYLSNRLENSNAEYATGAYNLSSQGDYDLIINSGAAAGSFRPYNIIWALKEIKYDAPENKSTMLWTGTYNPLAMIMEWDDDAGTLEGIGSQRITHPMAASWNIEQEIQNTDTTSFIIRSDGGLIALNIFGNVNLITPTATIKPDNPQALTTLMGYCNSSYEEENNDTISYDYKWYINGLLNETGTNDALTSGEYNIANLSGIFKKGDNITFSCKAKNLFYETTEVNSTEKTIINTAPNITETHITPSPANTTDDLTCNTTTTDADNDSLTYEYNWTTPNEQLIYHTQTLGAGNLTGGLQIWCSAKAYDGEEYSEWVTSDTLTIGDDTPPIISDWSVNPSPLYTDVTPIYVDCYDTSPLATGYPKVQFTTPENITLNLSMVFFTGNTYVRNYVFGFVGQPYTDFIFYCSDGSGNLAYNITNLSVTSTLPPTPPGGGGGGGSTTREIFLTANATAVCGDKICSEGEDPLSCPEDCRVNFDTLFTCLFRKEGTEPCNWDQAWFPLALLIFVIMILGISAIQSGRKKR